MRSAAFGRLGRGVPCVSVATEFSTSQPREPDRKRGDVQTQGRWALLLVLAGAIVVLASVLPGTTNLADRDEDPAEVPPSELPAGVTTYDVSGGPGPEFVSIQGEVLAVPRDTSDPWWVTALNPGSTLGAALIAAGAVWYQTTRSRADLERRLTELEGRLRAAGDGSV